MKEIVAAHHRGTGAKAIGAVAARGLEPAARARGFTTLSLLQDWGSIAGADLAAFTMPDRVIWPRQRADEESDEEPERRKPKRTQGAVLVLRVDGPRAIEVQYRAQQIMQRVNGYFGYRAVVELRILQAPVAKSASPARPESLSPDPEVLPEGARIAETGLRAALIRLGTAIGARRR
jgi:hypothetical protein